MNEFEEGTGMRYLKTSEHQPNLHSGHLSEEENNQDSVFSDLATWLEEQGLQNSALYEEVQTAIKNEQTFRKILNELSAY